MSENNQKGPETSMRQPGKPDYSLTGENARRAVELGLAEADWYQSPVPKDTLRRLMSRRNGPAIRDTILLFTILTGTAVGTVLLWGTWWFLAPYLVYAVFYGTSSDSRWHECSHGTAFKTDWMNNALYEIASFMVMRESVVWRWSHTRHHSDTIIVGRDPEIQVPRPANIFALILSVFNINVYRTYYPKLIRHAFGRISDDEKTFIPSTEYRKVYRIARIYLLIYIAVIVSSILLKSWIPVFLIILPNIFGTWVMIVHNTTQHAGLAENVLDHRLNCRTVYMNPISRFIYWNMNYHLEHHMYPQVPYHALPELHEIVKDDCPPVYKSIYEAWSEILPAVLKQAKDPTYYVKRELPSTAKQVNDESIISDAVPDKDGWVEVCNGERISKNEAIRFDHIKSTFAVVRDENDKLYATDGICTHGNTHLSGGFIKGNLIECPKHNGRFNLEDGSPARPPVCRGLAVYPVEEREGRIIINIENPQGEGAREQKTYTFRVVSNENVATFIKEFLIETADNSENVDFIPGDYLQFDIPEYNEIKFQDFNIPDAYASAWKHEELFNLVSQNNEGKRRNNYSIASNNKTEKTLRFNVRIAMPPAGTGYPPGIGSSYIFNLKPGDTITAIGPFGDFHIKPTKKEMIYIGGGAGMAPIRAHLAHLFENESTERKVSYWYGARSVSEIYYDDYLKELAANHPNFDFHIALSDPLKEDKWEGYTGYIHEVALKNHLANHPNPKMVEFYLCGPPQMVSACRKMLNEIGVSDEQISFDEF